MKVLMIYPDSPKSFWGFEYALGFISKKAVEPPLGLLTVAAMLPAVWEKRVIDMKVVRLRDRDLQWADLVFISAMTIQRASADRVIARCREMGKIIVAGGPLFTSFPKEFPLVDHLVLGEAECTLPRFLDDFSRGEAVHLYPAVEFADVAKTPIPLWELIDMKHYATMNIQYSRGCPFHCDFCNISVLFGDRIRAKGTDQFLAELDRLFQMGWRGGVFIVDDNFIGNRGFLKNNFLPALIGWMEDRKHPFFFKTEVSINVADDVTLMDLMVRAGFDSVFVGIETPHQESLAECNKVQNSRCDLTRSVKKIQQSGLQVDAGFIIGFDHDPPSIFEKLTSFIQESGIITAMVGLLNAPHGTKLFQRLSQEGRIVKNPTGSNTDLSLNFIPKMDIQELIDGYRTVVDRLYSPKQFYQRVRIYLQGCIPNPKGTFRFRFEHLKAFLKSVLRLGIIGKERLHYWRLLFWTLFRRPKLVPLAVTYAIYGFHFRRYAHEVFSNRP